MGNELQKRLLQSRFEGPHHEALLNVLLASSRLRGMLDEVFEGADLTQGQYNVLRILNGVHPAGYARGEIARRVIDRAPDLTRMIDRLVKRGLVQRGRSREDGRHSIARITQKGRHLLTAMHPRVRAVQREMARLVSEREARELSRLCEKIYVGEE